MDKSGHWRRTSHCVRQPNIERDLRGLTSGTHKEQQTDRSENARAIVVGHVFGLREDGAEIQRPERREDQEYAKRVPKVPNAVYGERLFARVRSKFLQEVKADQQVAAQSHSFPSDE